MANEVRLIDAIALNKRFDEKEADDIELYGVHIADCFSADEAKEIVDQMPTIDPESLRPKGRWRLNKDGSGTCSECHRTRNDVWDMDNWDNFCSHCGAKMEG